MAQQNQPNAQHIENIKKALVSAGLLTSTSLSDADKAKLNEELAKHGVDAQQTPLMLVCHSSHWCLVVPSN